MSETVTVTNAKARLSELVAAVAATQDHVDITRNGDPAAVLVSHAELNALREAIANLSDAPARYRVSDRWTVELTGPARRALTQDLPPTPIA
ncbi:hypothetical protein BH24ACT13_BH24ACT13_04600 [soil metagenome]